MIYDIIAILCVLCVLGTPFYLVVRDSRRRYLNKIYRAPYDQQRRRRDEIRRQMMAEHPAKGMRVLKAGKGWTLQ